MKNFRCVCGNILYFENTHCLVCGRDLGFLPARLTLTALEPSGDNNTWQALTPDGAAGAVRKCRNYADAGVCNWVIPDDDPEAFCASCRLDETIPDLALAENRILWGRIERAKRRLLYTLWGLGLPIVGRKQNPQAGLGFRFLADPGETGEFIDNGQARQHVATGHRGGIITINIAEADPSWREDQRERMNELYRTLLGHFRHESAHYFWDSWIGPVPERLAAFRETFGDERGDYDTALERYYGDGPPADWTMRFVSAYAASHPWEDWAETWAHYLHMVDTLETARDYAFEVQHKPISAGPNAQGSAVVPLDRMVDDWRRLSEAMNALNRSMGQPDPYPFHIPDGALDKLRFVHDFVADIARSGQL